MDRVCVFVVLVAAASACTGLKDDGTSSNPVTGSDAGASDASAPSSTRPSDGGHAGSDRDDSGSASPQTDAGANEPATDSGAQATTDAGSPAAAPTDAGTPPSDPNDAGSTPEPTAGTGSTTPTPDAAPIDLCPADPLKDAPGLCGCGTADSDSDGDTMVDCIDPCPAHGALDCECEGNQACSSPKLCVDGHCQCTPNCSNKCGGGDDGCGGTCDASCALGQFCSSFSCAECNTNAHCGASGSACVDCSAQASNRACVNHSCSCSNSNDCASGEVCGCVGACSTPVFACQAKPKAPTGVTVTVRSSTTAGLSWTRGGSDEAGFVIERSATSASSGFAQVTSSGPLVASYDDTSLSPAQNYWYRWKAFNAAGDSPYTSAIMVRSGGVAYVANSGPGTVSVIDLMTHVVVKSIAAGAGAYGVAVDTTQRRAYVANQADDTVTAIDCASQSAIRTIGVGDNPQSIAANPARSRVYVANPGAWGTGSDTVSIIDSTTNAVVKTVTVGTDPTGIAIADRGNASGVFVSLLRGPLAVIALDTDAVSTVTIPAPATGTAPCLHDVAYQDATTRVRALVVPCDASTTAKGYFTEVLATTKAVGNTVRIEAAGSPSRIAVDPGVGGHIFTVHPSTNTLGVTEYVNNSFVTSTTVGTFPTFLQFVGAPYNQVFVTNCTSGTVSIVSAATNAVVDTVTVEGCPRGVAFLN